MINEELYANHSRHCAPHTQSGDYDFFTQQTQQSAGGESGQGGDFNYLDFNTQVWSTFSKLKPYAPPPPLALPTAVTCPAVTNHARVCPRGLTRRGSRALVIPGRAPRTSARLSSPRRQGRAASRARLTKGAASLNRITPSKLILSPKISRLKGAGVERGRGGTCTEVPTKSLERPHTV